MAQAAEYYQIKLKWNTEGYTNILAERVWKMIIYIERERSMDIRILTRQDRC